MMHSRTSRSCGRRRAMTLVEVLVAGGILTVVLGIAFGMMIESQKASRGIARSQTALQTSEMAMRAALEEIEGAIHPLLISGSSVTVPAPVFGSDAISFASYADEGQTLNFTSIKQTSQTIELHRRVLASLESDRPHSGLLQDENDYNKAGWTSISPLVRGGDDSFALSIQFAYASAAQPGMPPAYQEMADAAQWPDLVRVTITATPKDGSAPLVLQSAVTPGSIVNKNKQPEFAPAATTSTLAAPAPQGVAP